MPDLNIVLFQQALVWQGPSKNRQVFEKLIIESAKPNDLCVLPEMFTTGFTMAPEMVAEPMEGDTFLWMGDLAAKAKVAIVGSLVIEQNGQYFNRLVFMRPDKSYDVYDKRHLFRMGNEQEHYQAEIGRASCRERV